MNTNQLYAAARCAAESAYRFERGAEDYFADSLRYEALGNGRAAGTALNYALQANALAIKERARAIALRDEASAIVEAHVQASVVRWHAEATTPQEKALWAAEMAKTANDVRTITVGTLQY